MVESAKAAAGTARRQWIVIGATVASVVLLVGSWSLANALLPAGQPIRSGEAVALDHGGGAGYRPSLRFAENGWRIDLGTQGLVHSGYRFERGPLELTAVSVTPLADTPPDIARLWDGMGEIARVENPDVRLGEPEAFTTEEGLHGLTGQARSPGREGAAVVVSAPDGVSAVEMRFSAPEGFSGLPEAVERVTRSVVFSKEEGA